MKKLLLVFFVLFVVAVGVLAVIWFAGRKALGPVLLPPPRDIASEIENNVREQGDNGTDFPLTLPEGFDVDVFAKNLSGVRVIAIDPRGNMWVSRRSEGVITLLTVENGEVVNQDDVIRNLKNPHGLAFDIADPYVLYIAEEDQIIKIRTYSEAPPEKVVDLPSGGRHVTRTLFWGADNRLYVSIGSTCDVCEEQDARNGSIQRVDIENGVLEPVATGLRNAVFGTVNPVDGGLWVTEMGRDMLGDDVPPDEINIVQGGSNYGWPICFGKNIHDTEFDKKTYIRNPCEDTVASYIDLPAHVAPLGLAFVPEEAHSGDSGQGWPEEYWYDVLIAFHGSWNRPDPVGYSIARVAIDAQGNFEHIDADGKPMIEDFISGWLTDDNRALGRPVDIVIQPGGIMYVSDDKAGLIYKISYGNGSVAPSETDTTDVSDLIIVTYPKSGQGITSPLRFEGVARGTWFFEASFPVQVLDMSGKKIGTGIAQAEGDWMTEDFVPFVGTVEFTEQQVGNAGSVVFQKDNPSDIRELDASFIVPITFVADASGVSREQDGCVITGCSSQVCADEEIITDCQYKEEYICYQKAECKRNSAKECAWQIGRDVAACLAQFE